MIHPPLPPLYDLAQSVQVISTNSTNFGCPPLDGSTRSVWSILGSCALTLLISVWHAIHFNLDCSDASWANKPVALVLLSFFAPEMVVMIASLQWWDAREKVIVFREKGYQWSMTHSFFAEMGGFVYRDDEGDSHRIDSLEFLELCEANKIANPGITYKEIKDRSKSNTLGKAIFALQLLWFTLQVIVRGFSGLAVTLVELDTVAMAGLTLLVLALWWDKPLRPKCPHIFYSPLEIKADPQTRSTLSTVWKSEHSSLYTWITRLTCTQKRKPTIYGEETALLGGNERPLRSKRNRLMNKHIASVSFCGTWVILGALHLIAWNFYFPTETERTIWRIASLVLTGTPLLVFVGMVAWHMDGDGITMWFLMSIGVASRTLLVALMLASLRTLPCSAHQTISWVYYIPHL